VIERDERAHAGGENGVGKALVVVDSLLIHGSFAGWLDSWPSDGVAIAAQVHLLHERDIFGVTVVFVTSDVTGPTALNVAKGLAEAIPYRFAAAINVPSAFHLIGGSRGAP
jgi:hypothetical protein